MGESHSNAVDTLIVWIAAMTLHMGERDVVETSRIQGLP